MTTRLPVLNPVERVRGCCAPLAPPLSTDESVALTALFQAVADPARLQMLHMLKAVAAPVCVCDFTAALDLGQPTISHHLAKLKAVGLVTSEKRGIWAFYMLREDLSAAARGVLGLIP